MEETKDRNPVRPGKNRSASSSRDVGRRERQNLLKKGKIKNKKGGWRRRGESGFATQTGRDE